MSQTASACGGTSKRKKGITAPFLVVGLIATVLAVVGWYFLPSMFEGDRPAIETTQVSLSTGFEKARAAIISPDGKLVAFKRLRQGKQESLAVRRLADGETIDLLSDLDKDLAIWATFSPDSKFIHYNLYKKDEAGLYRVPVTGGPGEKLIAGIYSAVAFSRDGNQMTFRGNKQGQEGATVFVADKNGKNQKAISTIKSTNYITQLLFSNDGQRVLVWEGERF